MTWESWGRFCPPVPYASQPTVYYMIFTHLLQKSSLSIYFAIGITHQPKGHIHKWKWSSVSCTVMFLKFEFAIHAWRLMLEFEANVHGYCIFYTDLLSTIAQSLYVPESQAILINAFVIAVVKLRLAIAACFDQNLELHCKLCYLAKKFLKKFGERLRICKVHEIEVP